LRVLELRVSLVSIRRPVRSRPFSKNCL